jgi:hypothetical protein
MTWQQLSAAGRRVEVFHAHRTSQVNSLFPISLGLLLLWGAGNYFSAVGQRSDDLQECKNPLFSTASPCSVDSAVVVDLTALYTFSLIKQLQDCPTRERMETEQLKLQSVEKIVEIFVCEAPEPGIASFQRVSPAILNNPALRKKSKE